MRSIEEKRLEHRIHEALNEINYRLLIRFKDFQQIILKTAINIVLHLVWQKKSIYRVTNIHIKILFGSIQAWLRRKRLKLELSTKSCRYKKLFRFVSSPLFLLSKRYMNLAGWCADRLAGVEKWDTKMVGEIFNKQLCFYCVQRHRKNCARKREREREINLDARALDSLSSLSLAKPLAHTFTPSIPHSVLQLFGHSLTHSLTHLLLTLSQKHKYDITGTMTESERGKEKIAGWR